MVTLEKEMSVKRYAREAGDHHKPLTAKKQTGDKSPREDCSNQFHPLEPQCIAYDTH